MKRKAVYCRFDCGNLTGHNTGACAGCREDLTGSKNANVEEIEKALAKLRALPNAP